MRVIVIGAGLSGVTAAWYLRQHGHEVTVVERREAAGLETSFANGGLIAPSQPDPWNAPGILGKLIHYLGKEDSPFLLRPSAIPGMIGWGLRFLRNSNEAAWKRNTLAGCAIGMYSLRLIRALRAETGLAYDIGTNGTMKIFRDQQALDAQIAMVRMLEPLGVRHVVHDRAATLAQEPALQSIGEQIVGAVYFPDDEYGDAHQFTQALAAAGAQRGIAYRYGETVTGIDVAAGRFAGVTTDRGELAGDALVFAAAAWTPALAKPLGLRVWINPVKGYSVTVSTAGWNNAPRVPIMDDVLKVAIAHFGGKLRMAGTAEFTGWAPEMNERRARNVLDTGIKLLPELAQQAERAGVKFWTGLRPMSPDGSPFIGPTGVPGIFINAGHGPMGWGYACGSGKLAADLVHGAKPEIDPAPYAPDRPL
jgi:D-amino-acid dehydrogenase